MSRLRRFVPLTATLLAMACGTPEPTWSEDVRPIVAEHCAGCHFEGGTAPFTMQTYDDVVAIGPAALAAVSEGRMPPWMPDPDCRTFQGERGMTPDEIETFTTWVEGAAREGEPTDPIVFESTVFVGDLTGLPVEPYTPNYDESPDDYRCFALDLEFDEDVYVSGSQVIPDSAAVHHVLLYALEGDQIAQMEAADAAEPGPGYTCFGGPVPTGSEDGGVDANTAANFPNQIGAWVPGIEPALYPDDVGIRITAGSKVVMQVHYSAAAAEPAPDQTRFELALHDTPPARLAKTRPFAIPSIEIPAGQSDVQFTGTITNFKDTPITLAAFTGHMHLLGAAQTARVVRANGDAECALDIPDWDFDWQQNYRLPTDELIVLQPGDGLELTCVYDNSAENQPVVNGVKQQPRDVAWGDGSLDEMCLLYLSMIEDYEPVEPPPATACEPTAECMASCDSDDLDCLLTCDDLDVSCFICVFEASLGECGMTTCALTLATARDCLTDCITGAVAFDSTLGPCLAGTCPSEMAGFAGCAQPTIDAGTCAPALEACGLTP